MPVYPNRISLCEFPTGAQDAIRRHGLRATNCEENAWMAFLGRPEPAEKPAAGRIARPPREFFKGAAQAQIGKGSGFLSSGRISASAPALCYSEEFSGRYLL
jgi:hypothetical protein